MKTSLPKRLLSLLLVLCMVLPMVPAITLPTKAATAPVVVIAGSDFQHDSGDTAGAEVVEGLLTSIKNNGGYSSPSGFLFGGDYSHYYTEGPTKSGVSALKGAVNAVYPNLGTSDSAIYIQGNHDPDSCVTDGTLSASGAHDAAAYGVYVINEKDYMWYNNEEATVKNTASNLRDYLNRKITQSYGKPIFVISHLPLHYCMRTKNDGDGQYANYIFDVLNDAGACGLNIIFMYGHNHSNGWDDYLGGAAVYLKKGDSINIAQGSRTEFKAETLNFTYMNPGFVGYYRDVNSGTADVTLTMTTFEITDTTVTVKRFDSSGVHNLKSKGVTNTYKSESGYYPNTTVYTSPQTITLTQPPSITDGVSVVSDGVTGVNATAIASNTPKGYSAYMTLDIEPVGYTQGNTAAVTVPVNDTFDLDRPVVVIDRETGVVQTCPIVDCKVTFTTNHFSDYTLAQAEENSVTATGTADVIIERVTSASELKAGVPYIITDYNEGFVLTGTYRATDRNNNRYGLVLGDQPSVNTKDVWYFTSDDASTQRLVYGSADSDQYLLLYQDSAGARHAIASDLTSEHANHTSYATLYSGDQFIIGTASGGYLNQDGGSGYRVATYRPAVDYSYWCFNALTDGEVTLTATPGLSALTTAQVTDIATSVTVEGENIDDYTIAWSSSDESVATVSADGRVNAISPGSVAITATLTHVNGRAMNTVATVKIVLSVYDVSKTGSVATGEGILLENVLRPVIAVPKGSGPYVISNPNSGTYRYLSGNMMMTTDDNYHGHNNAQGLEIVATNDFSHLWYYDDEGCFRYGSPDGQYLSFTGSTVCLLNDKTSPFDTLTPTGNGDFYIKNSNLSGNQNLNQYGGTGCNVAYIYGSGSWNISKVVANPRITLNVVPGDPVVMVNRKLALDEWVMIDGVSQGTYTVSWSSEDPTIAKVEEDTVEIASGVFVTNDAVIGVAPGKTTLTCTLTSLNGDTNFTEVVARIPVEVTGEGKAVNSVTASGYTGKTMNKVQNLVQGTPSGPYVLKDYSADYYLSGNGPVTSTYGATGLETITTGDFGHVWYYDGTHLRYNAPDGPFLAYVNGQVTLSDNVSDAFDNVVQYGSYEGYAIQKTDVSGSNYINRLGGGTNNAVGMYDQAYFSRWFFYEVPHKPVTLRVTPDMDAVKVGETTTLLPAVTLDGVYTDTYTISWASSDTSVATVSNGVVTGVASGRAIITATLTQVDGLNTELHVEIPISVLQTTDNGTKATTSTVIGPQLVQLTEMPDSPGGPYVIVNSESNRAISGTEGYRNIHTTGLWLKPVVHGDYTDVWYFDGVGLVYGDPAAKDRYMVLESGRLGLNSADYPVFDTFIPTTNENYAGSFSIGGSRISGYINQKGGSYYRAIGLYASTADVTGGSAWEIYALTGEQDVQFSVQPSKTTLEKAKTGVLTPSLVIDGVEQTDFEVSWTSLNEDVAQVKSDGTVLAVGNGQATVVATVRSVNGKALDFDISVPVTITVNNISSVTISEKSATVNQHSAQSLPLGPTLTVKYKDGVTETVNLTTEHLTDADGKQIYTETAGTFENLKVVYEGYEVCSDFTLTVVGLPDYPEYPNEGAVMVDKWATDNANFQSSGVAQVELTVSGIPAEKGADVIIMLDTSSSMDREVGGVSRLNVLCQSLNNLIGKFQQPTADGTVKDINVAIANFNSYFNGAYNAEDTKAPYYVAPEDTLRKKENPSNSDNNDLVVYTGDKSMTAGGFVSAADLGANPFYTENFNQTSANRKFQLTATYGTNYDYAFDVAYQLASAVNEKNAAAGQDRDLYVIFMSDGHPFQFNYFYGGSTNEEWNNWLDGTVTDEMFAEGSHKEYYNEDGEHWMAEAIKGKPTEKYPVIRKNDSRDLNGDNMFYINGLGATMYSIGFCMADDKLIRKEVGDDLIYRIATSSKHAYLANTADELDNAFAQISDDILLAVSDAYFIDPMGEDFDLQMGNRSYYLNNVATTFTDNKIQVTQYKIYTLADYETGKCTLDQVGTRKASDGEYPKVLETVTFNADGTEAYSDVIGAGVNILKNGIICANTFWYNSNATSALLDINGNKVADKGDYTIGAESFYWKVGTITTDELALSYYVYLTDAQGENEGKTAGIYPTNDSATLYYQNYLGHDCFLVTEDPTLPWGHAQVGYAFYLVDENGNPLDSNGTVTSFQTAVKVGNVTYQGFTANNKDTGDTRPVELVAKDLVYNVLPSGYRLFDDGAAYHVYLNSDGAGGYSAYTKDLGGGKTLPQTTYIKGMPNSPVKVGAIDGNPTLTENFASGNTVAWFAVYAVKKADVSYGFYLVDKDGNPIVDETTGATGSFENAVKVGGITSQDFPVDSTSSIYASTVSSGKLPEGVYLYDNGARYEVGLDSDGSGSTKVYMGTDCNGKQTTYVTGLPTDPYLAGSTSGTAQSYDDYSFATDDTVVWFAVYAVEDPVVSYGFYLVDKDGKPIVNKETGETGSFEDAVKVGDVTTQTFEAGSSADIVANSVASGKLPENVYLYDTGAKYNVGMNTDGSGSTTVYMGTDCNNKPTTYVTGLPTDPYLAGGTAGVTKTYDKYSFDTQDSTVWFAVYEVEAPEVSYGFYLVDKDGKPIVNKETGETGSFEDAVKVGDVTTQTFEAGSSADIVANSVASGKLPENVYLYDTGAKYNVGMNTDGSGSTTVYMGTDCNNKPTTYVTGLPTDPYLAGGTAGVTKTYDKYSFDTQDSTVWFAVYEVERPTVGYGFYLVDKDGNPIVNQATGATGTFTDAVKIGEVTYGTISTDSTVSITANNVASGKLPEGLYLYDTGAKYRVRMNTDGSGSTTVYMGTDCNNKATTYVTGLPTDPYLDGSTEGTTVSYDKYSFATQDSVVWYAVYANIEVEDYQIVIDYGLYVNIDPIKENTLMPDGKSYVYGIIKGDYGEEFTAEAPAGFTTTLKQYIPLNYGSVQIRSKGETTLTDAYMRYRPTKMEMPKEDVFTYAIHYTGDIATHGYYYATVMVIPATEIYYEDDFVTFSSYTTTKSGQYGTGTAVKDTTSKWTDAGTVKSALQTQSTPGANPTGGSYGMDGNYFKASTCATYSMGSAKKLEVGYKQNSAGTYDYTSGTAEFTFWGTGFDVISMTNATTGVIMVRVYDADSTSTTALANYMVDTYYGYKFDTATNKWVEDTEEKDTLYQVPVIKVDMNKVVKTYDDPDTAADETEYYDYGYGHYKVVITVSYNYLFNHGQIAYKEAAGDNTEGYLESYDFYLDAIRIYDPANDGETSENVLNAYIADDEAWPVRYEVRNLLLGTAEYAALGTAYKQGAIFIDGIPTLDDSTASGVPGTENNSTSKSFIADYANFGPNNELYLAPGQAVAFDLANDSNVAKIRMAIRSVGNEGAMKIAASSESVAAATSRTIPSATDCNWILTGRKGTTTIIYNSGETVLSLTNITATHYSAPTSGSGLLYVNRQTGENALNALGAAVEETVQPTLTLKYPTLSFEDEILYNVYFSAENTDDVAELGLLTFDTEVTDGTVDNCTGNYPAELGADGLYMASTDGVAAKKLGDTVYFKAYAKLTDGTYVYSVLRSYSAKQYAAGQLAGSDESVKPLVVAMLNYGAAAQQSFSYRTDALVNADLTAQQQALVVDYSSDMFSGIPTVDAAKAGAFAVASGFSRKYPTVSFEGAFAINYYFTPSNTVDGDMTLYCWTQEAYDSAEGLTADNAVTVTMSADESGVYHGCYDGIAAKDLGDNVYVAAVYESEGVRCCTGVLGYSVGAYCKSHADNVGSELNAMAQATAVYAHYAEAYFTEN